MVNFFPTWLLFASALVISTAQDVGRFAYEDSLLNMHYDINENHEVTLTVEVRAPRLVRGGRGDVPAAGHRNLGPYPLRKVEDFIYTIDFENSGITSDDWHESVENFLRSVGVLDLEDPFDHERDQPPPLATLHYTSGDDFFVNLGEEELLCMRVGRELLPGEYVYKETVAPFMRISYKFYENGVGGIRVRCRRRSTTRFPHKLSRRDRGFQYLHHAVEPVGHGTLAQFLKQVKDACRGKHPELGDFSRVVVATAKTIYVASGGGRLALTKV
ncbi:hypothetical protein FOZ63_017550 [Perkinsus olseni]|uniref:Uncharacterized protein n=1 Tax=Perkinsus olseni TaxID=32597 RepID=A0A7J6U9P2_PEROL|nr:hypothetical protein FOZ63_017550 [Perkinsus olseni]